MFVPQNSDDKVRLFPLLSLNAIHEILVLKSARAPFTPLLHLRSPQPCSANGTAPKINMFRRRESQSQFTDGPAAEPEREYFRRATVASTNPGSGLD